MWRMLVAGPLSIVAAVLGAAFATLAIVSPRLLGNVLVKLTDREIWRSGWMIEVTQPGSWASALLRIMARALGAFGAARLVLFVLVSVQ